MFILSNIFIPCMLDNSRMAFMDLHFFFFFCVVINTKFMDLKMTRICDLCEHDCMFCHFIHWIFRISFVSKEVMWLVVMAWDFRRGWNAFLRGCSRFWDFLCQIFKLDIFIQIWSGNLDKTSPKVLKYHINPAPNTPIIIMINDTKEFVLKIIFQSMQACHIPYRIPVDPNNFYSTNIFQK